MYAFSFWPNIWSLHIRKSIQVERTVNLECNFICDQIVVDAHRIVKATPRAILWAREVDDLVVTPSGGARVICVEDWIWLVTEHKAFC